MANDTTPTPPSPPSSDSTTSPSGPSSPTTSAEPTSGEQSPSELSALFDQIERGGDTQQVEAQKVETAKNLPGDRKAREYADDEEKKIFSAMSNEAYNRLYPEWKKIRSGEYVPKTELEKVRQEVSKSASAASRWEDHPKAYTLSEDYADVADSQELYNDIMQHYQSALASVEAGRPFMRVIPDEKQKWVIDQKQQIPPSAEAKAFIIAQMQRFGGLQQQNAGKLESIKQQSAKEYGEFKAAMERSDRDVFGPIESNPQFASAWKAELNRYPAALRNSLQYQLLAKASVIIQAIQAKGKQTKTDSIANATQPQNIAGASSNPDQRKQLLSQLDQMASR